MILQTLESMAAKRKWRIWRSDSGNQSAGMSSDVDQTVYVERQLEDLADLGYVELDEAEGTDAPRAALTAEGYDLLRITEDVLLATSAPASVRESDPR